MNKEVERVYKVLEEMFLKRKLRRLLILSKEERRMNERRIRRIAIIGAVIILAAIISIAVANKGLSYWDPPRNVEWAKYEAKESQYLSIVAGRLTNLLHRDLQSLVRSIRERNNLHDNFLRKGQVVSLPVPYQANKEKIFCTLLYIE